MSVFENVFAPAARSLDHGKLIMSKNMIFRECEIFKHTIFQNINICKYAYEHIPYVQKSKSWKIQNRDGSAVVKVLR